MVSYYFSQGLCLIGLITTTTREGERVLGSVLVRLLLLRSSAMTARKHARRFVRWFVRLVGSFICRAPTIYE
eukprot:scaffold3929_cov46-Attheya_sp.AAC.1